MGVGYYSGETLSLDGRTPLPIDVGNLTLIIAVGYILSIVFMIVLPRCIVWAERITASVALLSALTLFFPFVPEVLSFFYYIQCFCCLFMIGFETALIVNLFTEQTAIKYLTVAYAIDTVLVAILHNDFIKVPFPAFRLLMVITLALMLVFFFKLPANVWPRYVRKDDNLVAPKTFFTGILFLTGLGCLLALFGNTVAESVEHGLFVFYTSTAIFGLAVFLLWKRFGISPLNSVSVLFAITALGFVIAIVARFIPALLLLSCALLGAGQACGFLVPFFGILIAKRYPSRYIAPAIIGIAFITVLLHMALLEALRNNLTALYMVYLVVAVSLIVLYLVLMPYLIYNFRNRTLQDIIGVVADDKDDDEPVKPETVSVAAHTQTRPPLLRTSPKTTPSPAPKEEPLHLTTHEWSGHERRMKALMSRAPEPLTRREYQAADGIMRGLRRSEIAKEMQILPESVTKYTNRIYDKFGIHRRQDLFKLAETLDREWVGDE
jgi:DNA-binding CsgD family transcriptional regulator